MPTNKLVLKSTEEFMTGYTPVYAPLYPIMMSRSQQHPAEVANVDFKRVTAVGDIRARHITPKDTEIKQINVGDGKKSFKKYFLANQFRTSSLQSSDDLADVNAQVLDEHQKQMDELVLLGDGTSPGDVLNNGLYFSNDANYVLESSIEIPKGTATDYLKGMHAAIMGTVDKANEVSGKKLLLLYGASVLSKYNSLYSTSDTPFSSVLGKVLNPDGGANEWSVSRIPSAVTPAGQLGWIVVNLDNVKLHYTKLPALENQGVNEEKLYAWFNFMMGSAMVEVLTAKGIIRQPITLEA